MEGKERHVEQPEQLEGDVGLGPRLRQRIGAVMPGPQEGLAPEGIATRPAERMPVADRKARMVFKALAVDDPILVVPAERERAFGILAAKGDRRACIEEFG